MKTNIRDEPTELTVSKQDIAAIQAFVYIICALIGSGVMLLIVMTLIASQRQQSSHLQSPPSSQLLLLFYIIGVACLLGATFWRQAKLNDALILPSQEFRTRIFICFGIVNICEYLGFVWFFLGGSLTSSLPLLIIPPLFTLLSILPVVLKRAAFLKQHSGMSR